MAEAKAFVPFPTPETARVETFVPWSAPAPPTAVPPPAYLGKGRDLICAHCENPIELGEDHFVLSSCVAVPSKKDPSKVVSENHQETQELPIHQGCLFDMAVDRSLERGDGDVDSFIEQYFGCQIIPSLCVNCGADVPPETVPEILCEYCTAKME